MVALAFNLGQFTNLIHLLPVERVRLVHHIANAEAILPDVNELGEAFTVQRRDHVLAYIWAELSESHVFELWFVLADTGKVYAVDGVLDVFVLDHVEHAVLLEL